MITLKTVEDAIVIVIDSKEDMTAFKQMVVRGTKTWPASSPAIKEFAASLTELVMVLTVQEKPEPAPEPPCGHQWIVRKRRNSENVEFLCRRCGIKANSETRIRLQDAYNRGVL